MQIIFVLTVLGLLFFSVHDAPGLVEICNSLEASEKPVVAAIHGTALGGGCEIAISSHYRVVHEQARLDVHTTNRHQAIKQAPLHSHYCASRKQTRFGSVGTSFLFNNELIRN